LGGDGVGLLRSEFLFMERSAPPSEDEQFAEYKAIALAIGADRSLIIRTLDVGGDKPLAYLPIPKEDNPFLGERGIRVGLDRPEVLRTQLRALLRASQFGKLRVMFPMIATIGELRGAKAILAEEASSLEVVPMPCGIMVEIPAVAVMADVFAEEADFFSIGTNDLTQYTLAMDRGHPKLAPKVDALHPGLLRLIAQTVEGARKHNFGRADGISNRHHRAYRICISFRRADALCDSRVVGRGGLSRVHFAGHQARIHLLARVDRLRRALSEITQCALALRPRSDLGRPLFRRVQLLNPEVKFADTGARSGRGSRGGPR
jgi:phosphoenolpyruvate synthase/pyruvate phosphate dikinase